MEASNPHEGGLAIFKSRAPRNQAAALSGSTTDCAPDVMSGISGHGFLIASESFTRHPSGPGTQPMNLISEGECK